MSNIVPFRRPPSPWQCPRCGWYVPLQSATAVLHYQVCVIPRLKAERLAEDRHRLRKTRGVPIRRPGGPVPRRLPHQAAQERIARLRTALCDPEAREAIMAITRLPEAALDRVALGRSTLAPSTWRRLAPYLGESRQ